MFTFLFQVFIVVSLEKMHKIGFIGGGKIAQAMAKGFIKAGMLIKSIQTKWNIA